MSESLASIIARIKAVHAEQGTPLDSFTDSRPADLSDLCADLGITLEQAQAAQSALLSTPAPIACPVAGCTFSTPASMTGSHGVLMFNHSTTHLSN